MKYPLKSTLRSVKLRIGGQDFPHDLTTKFEPYAGQEMLLNASVANGILTITIDKDGPEQLSGGQPATSAIVTLSYARHDAGTLSETWHIAGINYGGGDLRLAGKITGVIPKGDVDFTVTDEGRPGGDSDTFGFLLIQTNAGTAAPPEYMIQWVGDPEIKIGDHTLFTTAEIIQPDEDPGSMSGPMGIQMP